MANAMFADTRLMVEISNSPLFGKVSGSLHKGYPNSFKSNKDFMFPGNLQFSFSKDGTLVDIDIDLFRNSGLHLFGEVIPNHIADVINKVFKTGLPDKTNQDAVRRMLLANPQIGLTRSPDPNFN